MFHPARFRFAFRLVYFGNIQAAWNKSLDTLECDYFRCFRQLKTDNVWDLWARAIEKKPKLFEKVN